MDTQDDDDTPRDLDELRIRLARRLANFQQDWRRCPARRCRRIRGCVDDAMICAPPLVNNDGVDDAAIVAEFYQALKAEMAKRGMDG